MRNFIRDLVFVLVFFLGAFNVMADGARDWQNVPIDSHFLYLYYTYSSFNTAIDSPLPADGASVNAHVPVLRYAYSFAINNKISAIQLVAPYSFVETKIDGTQVKRKSEGLGDITAIFVANISGAPALTKDQYLNWVPESYWTASIALTMPTGEYDKTRLINIGKNRYALKPQISYGLPMANKSLLAVNANVQIFTDNDEYLSSNKLSQKALVSMDAHYSYTLNRALWISADAFYQYGGETAINDNDQNNKQSTAKLGVSGSLNVSAVDAIAISLDHTVIKKDYTPGGWTFAINYNHVW